MALSRQEALNIARKSVKFYESVINNGEQENFGGNSVVQLRLSDAFASLTALSSNSSSESDIQHGIVYAEKIKHQLGM